MSNNPHPHPRPVVMNSKLSFRNQSQNLSEYQTVIMLPLL